MLNRALVSALLVLGLALSMWSLPNCHSSAGVNGSGFEVFGPRINEIQVMIFANQSEEFAAFKNKQIDIMNEPLTPAQRAELEAIDPDMTEYVWAWMTHPEVFEIDFNNQRFPTNDVWFRRAVSHLLDREAYVASQDSWWYGQGEASPAYSPLMHLDNANHTGWYNPYCSDLYPFDPEAAAQILDAHGYVDSNSDGYREGPAGENVTLVFYVRGDDPNRVALGDQLTHNLQTVLAQQPPGYAGIRVDERVKRRFQDQIFVPVMQTHEYNMYTGHWWFTSGNYLPTHRDPASLISFTSKYSYMQFMPDDLTMNYLLYRNSEFDEEVRMMLMADSINGGSSEPAWPQDSAKHYCWEAQKTLMDDAALIPVVSRGGYKACLTGWSGVVDQLNQGLNSYWSFLNMHLSNSSFGGVLRYGFCHDVESLNPVTALNTEVAGFGSCWNWDVLGKIYETLLASDPHDGSVDIPNLCKNWSIGNWTHEGENCTAITFRLREDAYWQDVPAKFGRTYNILPSGRTSKLLTADDVKFTIEYVRGCSGAVNQPLLVNWSAVDGYHYGFMNVVDVETPDPFTVTVYYDEYAPWSALHMLGFLPILPRDIWENVPVGGVASYNPWAEDTLYGSGPFILAQHIPGASMTLKAWRRGVTYGGIVAETGFHDGHLVLASVNRLPQSATNLINDGEIVNFSVVLSNVAEFAVTVQYRVDYDNDAIQIGSMALANASQEGSCFSFSFQRQVTMGLQIGFPPKPDGGEGTPWQSNLLRPLHYVRVSWNVTDPTALGGYESTWSNVVYEYVYVRIPGDIDGDFAVTIFDLVKITAAYNVEEGDPRYGANIDLDGNGRINIFDVVICTGHYGMHYQ